MNAKDIVDKLVEGGPDDLEPKAYLRQVKPPMLELAKKQFVIGMIDAPGLDSRNLVIEGLKLLGVPTHVAMLIALEQGSSQAYVDKRYLRAQGLTDRVLQDASDFIKFVYKLERDGSGLAYRLYDLYHEAK